MSTRTTSPARIGLRALAALAVVAGAAGPAASAQARLPRGHFDLPIPSIGLPAVPFPHVPVPDSEPQPKISAAFHPKALLAHRPDGQRPNAPATDPVISGDGRIAQWASYASRATDIVAGSGAAANVYLVERAGPYSLQGTPWREKRTVLASPGIGGPADGDSWGGTFDGREITSGANERTIAPTCFAFVSAASNLVAGDADGAADVFVRDLGSGRLTRIPSSAGATEVDLDGTCDTVAFVSGGVARVAAADGSGRATPISGAGASSLELATDGRNATYQQAGAVWHWQQRIAGPVRRRLASATSPTANSFASDIAYRRGSALYQARLKGPLDEKRMVSPLTDQKVYGTTDPSMTAGGHFVFFGNGPYVDSNVYRNFALCPYPGGEVAQVMGSAHGNYAVFTCSTGDAWLSYVGPK